MPTHNKDDTIEAATKAVEALLVSIGRSPSPAATVAFQSAIRRYGHHVYDLRGPEGFAAVLAGIKAASPEESKEHKRIVLEAWKGIEAE